MNKLSSTKTQLPYEYYSLPFCRPPKIINSAENLGEVLRGDRIENSVFKVRACQRPAPAARDTRSRAQGACAFSSGADACARCGRRCDTARGCSSAAAPSRVTVASPPHARAQLAMREEDQCRVTCTATLSAEDVREFRSRIEDDYRINMCVGAHARSRAHPPRGLVARCAAPLWAFRGGA